MTVYQILDELGDWLEKWEHNCICESLRNNANENMQSACNYHIIKQRVYAIRHMKDKLKELREKANAE